MDDELDAGRGRRLHRAGGDDGERKIERLRRQASGRYISASEPGLFNYEDGKATVVKKGDRAVQFNLDELLTGGGGGGEKRE